MGITAADFLLFCDRTIDGMTRAVQRLDDESVNVAPPLPGANTPFQLVTHALAAAEYWVSHHVCGLPSSRVRDNEFRASGTVADLVAAAETTRRRLRELGPQIDAATEVHFEPTTSTPLGTDWTVGAALLHAYEELAQHLGHLEITVDLLESGAS